jgi:hypothetical protein
MTKRLDDPPRADPAFPSPMRIATWDDDFRLLDRESTARERHWGELPIDREFEHLREKGWLNGSIDTPAELRHRVCEAAHQAYLEYAGAEIERTNSPRARKIYNEVTRPLHALRQAIGAVAKAHGVCVYHPLVPLPPKGCDYAEFEPTDLDLRVAAAFDDCFRGAKSLLPQIARLLTVLEEYMESNTPTRGQPEKLRTHFVRHLVPVWRDLTGRAPGRVTDAYGEGRVSPFQRFCESALRTMHPLIEHGPLDNAVRAAIKHSKGGGRC